jgi:8-oxo-dGTP pyrophosphatase MutT (NUDIX family)
MNFSFRTFLESREYYGREGAGILAIAKDTGKWLLALRSPKVKEPGVWAGVGGKMEEGEDPEETATREFKEETGFRGKVTLHKAFKYRKPDLTFHNFIGEINKDTWEPKANWETEKFRWLTFDELLALKPKHFGLAALMESSEKIIKSFSDKYQPK